MANAPDRYEKFVVPEGVEKCAWPALSRPPLSFPPASAGCFGLPESSFTVSESCEHAGTLRIGPHCDSHG